ncbi:hypothetical protein EHP00_1958 [Ecytonucleospora hepatopenaei]|uniref:SAC domain-containing protein n=1 Tax=Ecytonucleospora hepatopenaei TaxID=646526 RepID=A0A1W0E2T9_9MICR|nr:hypothetical protein EHP00_1958 [Ecytonucleospora hepatopenaei]
MFNKDNINNNINNISYTDNTDNNINNTDICKYLLFNLFCGYYECQSQIHYNHTYYFCIVSYISKNKIGPRMMSRGVDEEGNVSFYVKTDFITHIIDNSNNKLNNTNNKLNNKLNNSNNTNNSYIIFTIYRGSVPLYWSQNDPLKPSKIWFNRSEEENTDAFIRHMTKSSISIINNSNNININSDTNNNNLYNSNLYNNNISNK